MKIEIFPMGVFQVNSYLLLCEKSGKVAVVDPGDEPEILLRRLDQLKAEPIAILNTHGHIDHVAGNAAIKSKFAIPALLHRADHFLVESFPAQAAMFGLDLGAPPLPDGELIPGKDVRARGLHAPDRAHAGTFSRERDSHSRERCDLRGCAFRGFHWAHRSSPRGLATLLRSIDEVLVPLGDEMRIHPGHGPQTSIGAERRSNPFLRKEFREQILKSVA